MSPKFIFLRTSLIEETSILLLSIGTYFLSFDPVYTCLGLPIGSWFSLIVEHISYLFEDMVLIVTLLGFGGAYLAYNIYVDAPEARADALLTRDESTSGTPSVSRLARIAQVAAAAGDGLSWLLERSTLILLAVFAWLVRDFMRGGARGGGR